MRHHVAGRHLNRSSGHRLALYRNLVKDLLRHERIQTTQAKAKEVYLSAHPRAAKAIAAPVTDDGAGVK